MLLKISEHTNNPKQINIALRKQTGLFFRKELRKLQIQKNAVLLRIIFELELFFK